ncbi:MAG: SDR family NAD(P)-dependent oxidoreductase [Bryobacteraceae bacterium]
MKPSTRLRQRYGPWAVVTGASDGIGRAFAVEAAQAGLHVALVARREDRLRSLAAEIETGYRVRTMVIPSDLSKKSGVEAVLEATGTLDAGLLTAAAGFGTSGPILRANLEEEDEMLAVNCYSAMALSVHFGRRFAARGRGGIVLMSSLVGWQGTPFAAHYAATKAYIQSLAEGMRTELEGSGVDVLASAPGPVHSGFAARANMRMGGAETPQAVAKASLSALGGRGTVVPGSLSKLLTYSLAMLPRVARTRVMSQVMRGMTKHQNA